MKYFGIFNTSGDVQTAIAESSLTKPYVAIVSGAVDYNTVSVSSNYMGTWSDNGEGTYTFHVDETFGFLDNWVDIATATLYTSEETEGSYTIKLKYDANSQRWTMYFYPDDELTYEFEMSDSWAVGLTVQAGVSDADVQVEFDGDYTFVFYTLSPDYPLTLTTINPVGE